MFLLVLGRFRWRPWMLIAVGGAILAFGRAVLGQLVDDRPRVALSTFPLSTNCGARTTRRCCGLDTSSSAWELGDSRPGEAGRSAGSQRRALCLPLSPTGTVRWSSPRTARRCCGPTRGPPTEWYAVAAHSYTAFEMLGNVGVAFAVIAAVLLARGRSLPRVTWPLAADRVDDADAVLRAPGGDRDRRRGDRVRSRRNVAWLALCVREPRVRERCGGGGWDRDRSRRVFTSVSTAVADADARRARVSGRCLGSGNGRHRVADGR